MPDRAGTTAINAAFGLPAPETQRLGGSPRHHILRYVALEDIKVVEGVFFKDTLKSPDDLMVGDSYRFPALPDTRKHPVDERAVRQDGRAAPETHLAVLMSDTGILTHARVVLTRRQGASLAIVDPVQDGSAHVLIALEPLCPEISGPAPALSARS
ncbi:hypothetical protein QO034_21315 [Sedimentitalea sp. JM2-8]|uniref:Uncharacterized protein n=1 Tax=Sedimentitalea xiamensis TaxID=3050037 RepID=A0ABT7FKE5_9RHOB|nr:hypothetical protein [Sedimentitalea xiamensis]MDK3075610.1 hypothetical protein [Sedimentitalea xiamensis]